MTEREPHEKILDPDLGPHEREALVRTAERLERNRPYPSPAFRGELRRSLLADRTPRARARATGPASVRRLIAIYAGSGAALLLVAAVGVAGAGPLGA